SERHLAARNVARCRLASLLPRRRWDRAPNADSAPGERRCHVLARPLARYNEPSVQQPARSLAPLLAWCPPVPADEEACDAPLSSLADEIEYPLPVIQVVVVSAIVNCVRVSFSRET